MKPSPSCNEQQQCDQRSSPEHPLLFSLAQYDPGHPLFKVFSIHSIAEKLPKLFLLTLH